MSELGWYHTFSEFGISGKLQQGHETEVQTLIPDDMNGKSVLDLGAAEGYYSYLSCKRGAKFALAIDNGIGEEICFGPDQNNMRRPDLSYPNVFEHKLAIQRLYKKYDFIRQRSNTNVHFVPMEVNDIDKIQGTFDYVFCFGIFYHVKNPYDLFEKCYDKCDEVMLLEGETRPTEVNSTMYINSKLELDANFTNYWSPSPSAITKLLTRVGFKNAEHIRNVGTRGLFRCFK
jgi:tRNA (mo5U34)-methyltransferase